MTIQSIALTSYDPSNDPYNAGYLDGELDAISKLPAAEANARASMADPYSPLWAQGYADGYLNQIQVTYELAQKQQAA
jgi:hypothetical protein